MIGTFWNICRACPSVPVEKLHSEYRSTYRWHEYAGPKAEVVRRPPQGFVPGHAQEPAFPRRKKHPDLAYRTHQILAESGSQSLLASSCYNDRARSEERWISSRDKNSRRSKSEGRQAEKATYSLIETRPSRNYPKRSCTFLKTKELYFNDESKAHINSTKPFGTRYNIRQNELLLKKDEDVSTRQPLANPRIDEIAWDSSPKKSVSMNGIKNKESNNPQETFPAVHRKTEELKKKPDQDLAQSNKSDTENNNMSGCGSKYQDDIDGEPKSEYKKNFQPFNRYEYDEQRGTFEKKSTPMTSYSNSSDNDSKSLSSWYREVVLLRQKANQYRHRGWGTELIPEHIAQLYNDQIMVWEQVSRRSTLSALSLATTVNCRDRSPSKEDKENRKNSPVKSLTRAKSAKASTQPTATHQGKPEKKKGASGGKAMVEGSPKRGNNQVKKLEIKRTSPNRTSRESGVGGQTTVPRALNPGSEKPKRRPRPTSLIATVPSGSKTAQTKIKGKKDGDTDEFSSLGHEQIIKSPPEPTRVKSPEQIVIRSPEPVNWTVPLDTGKTFTVTQNIREGDLAPRSYSEVRAWTPGSAAQPPASVSAPTELRELTKANVQ